MFMMGTRKSLSRRSAKHVPFLPNGGETNTTCLSQKRGEKADKNGA